MKLKLPEELATARRPQQNEINLNTNAIIGIKTDKDSGGTEDVQMI
jgi:hypothetical protein